MSSYEESVNEAQELIVDIYKSFKFDIIGFATSQGKIIPLNLEPGTLGNVIEGVLIAHMHDEVQRLNLDLKVTEGGNRSYPDLEITGGIIGNAHLALDIKAARRDPRNPNRTKSMITLYTFGTYLRDQHRQFGGMLRPFAEYKYHLDLIAIFDVNTDGSVSNFELIVVEPWRIATMVRSSGTRDYVGAIMDISKIRNRVGGSFSTRQEFYDFWSTMRRRGESAEASDV